MADTGKFASTSDVARKAGKNVSTISIVSTTCNAFLGEVESQINSATRFNFSDTYATLNEDTKGVLREVASNLAAIYAIQYDLSGYTSRIEAEDMINILRDASIRILKMLRDKKVTDFIREKT